MKSSQDLKNLLLSIDHKSYPAYKSAQGSYRFQDYILSIDHVQGDPFAAPSRVSLRISGKNAGFPPKLFDTFPKRVALQDHLLRLFGREIQQYNFKARGSGKSGLMAVSRCGQEILERSACAIDPGDGSLTLRMQIGFPASGRTIQAGELIRILFEFLPGCAQRSLFFRNIDASACQRTAELCEDQEYILGEVISYAEKLHPDAVVIAGDIYDKSVPSVEAGPSIRYIFSGKIKCGECGKSLTIRTTHAKHPQQIYACKTYGAFGKNHCTQHRVEYDTLYHLVLNKIRECAKAALTDGEAIAGKLTNTCEAEQKGQREALERSLTKDEERIEVLEKMVLRLYEDMVAGRISEANFNLMLDKTQKEQAELKERVAQGRKKLADEMRLAMDAKQWVDAIQEYADITELDTATLNRLIKEIVVHEHIDSDKTRHISIEIHFNLKPIPEVEQVKG